MNRNEIQNINAEINFTATSRNKVKSIGNEIAELTGKIELASVMTEEGILDVETYKNYVLRNKKEIKDMLALIYSYLKLEDTEGRYDYIFEEDNSK